MDKNISKSNWQQSNPIQHNFFDPENNETLYNTPFSDDRSNWSFEEIIKIALEIIILVGIVGNVLNVIVFSKKSMRQTSTFRFLLYLSIADMLVLIVCSTDALLRFGFQFEIRSYSNILCRLHTFLTYFLTHVSSTILMVISVDRALVINNKSLWSLFFKKPNKTKNKSINLSNQNHTENMLAKNRRKRSVLKLLSNKLHRVDLVIAVIILLLTLLNSHYFIFINLNLIKEDLFDPHHYTADQIGLDFNNQDNHSVGIDVNNDVLLTSTLLNFHEASTKSASMSRHAQIRKLEINEIEFGYESLNENYVYKEVFPNSSRHEEIEPQHQSINISKYFNKDDNHEFSNQSEIFYICFPLEGTGYNSFLNNIWIWIDICVYSLIPFIVMSICSIIILVRIRRKSQKYFRIMMNKQSQFSKNNCYKRLRRNRQLLYMLLITNLYFLLSLLPYCISFVLFKGQKGENHLGQLSVHILLYTNNAINFIFYGLSSQKYREELYMTFYKPNKSRNSTFNKSASSHSNNNYLNKSDRRKYSFKLKTVPKDSNVVEV